MKDTLADLERLGRFVSWIDEEKPPQDQAIAWLVGDLGLTSQNAKDNVRFLIQTDVLAASNGTLVPNEEVVPWLDEQSGEAVIRLMHGRIRFIGELLRELQDSPKNGEELLRIANGRFQLEWDTTRQISSRLKWLQATDLVKKAGHSKYQLTSRGADLLARLPLSPRTPSHESVPQRAPITQRRLGPYTVSSLLKEGCFMSKHEVEKLVTRLEAKRNLILQGPPGTGKTWLAKRLAYVLVGQRDRERVAAIQFHPTLSYEDFVIGWRPSEGGKLALTPGVFLRAIEAAEEHPDAPYVVVIEEINRGNPAQIFGELITLLEADKRTADEAVELAYSEEGARLVHVPENLYVIGTMNIADRSLALVDLALRRRFAFATLEPQLGDAWFRWVSGKMGVDAELAEDIQRRMVSLNETIAKAVGLGDQFRIGHSYVTPSTPLDASATKAWFRDVVETEIGPLLEEYWFDDVDQARRARDELLKDW